MVCKCSIWERIKIWIISLHVVMNSNGCAGDCGLCVFFASRCGG